MIYILGDSNVRAYDGLPDVFVHSISGGSMLSIVRLGIRGLAIPSGVETLLFEFGAVDCRTMLVKAAAMEGSDFETTANRVITQYVKTIKQHCIEFYLKPMITSIIPEAEIKSEHNKDEFRAIGSLSERIIRNKFMNWHIEHVCMSECVEFFDPYFNFRTAAGGLRMEREDPENLCHIAPIWWPELHNELMTSMNRGTLCS